MGIRQRGDSWQAYIYDSVSRKQLTVTCRTKRQAEKAELKLRSEKSAGTKKPRKEKIQSADSSKNKGILNAVLQYLKQAPLSMESKRNQIYEFRHIFADYSSLSIQTVADNIKVIMQEYFSKLSITPTTKNLRISYVSAFFTWCYENGYISEKPTLKKVRNARYQHFIPPTQDELSALLAVASPHIQRVIILGSQLGIRVGQSELFRIQWKDIDWSRRVLRLNAANKNKAEPMRELPLSDVMYNLFQIWYEQDKADGMEYLIHRFGKPIHKMSNSHWKTLLIKAGITRHFRLYDLRHAFATEAIASGADPGTVAKLMGHSSTDMVFKHYQHVMDKQKQAVMDNLSHSELCQNILSNCGKNCVKNLCQENSGQIIQ